MIRDAFEKILELAMVERFYFGGREYTSKTLVPVKEPTPPLLQVNTLKGFVDYLQSGFDRGEIGAFCPPPAEGCDQGMPAGGPLRVALHVVSPLQVDAFTAIGGPWKERQVYARAFWGRKPFPFGEWMSQESFVIKLLAMFQESEDLARIMEVAGRILCEDKAEMMDDGVSQAVTFQRGVKREDGKILPLRPRLRPVRTFTEVAQPESEFVFRLRSEPKVELSLHEADMGAWELEAKENIRTYLAAALPGVPVFV